MASPHAATFQGTWNPCRENPCRAVRRRSQEQRIGAGSDAPPASPTASPNTATRRASTRSLVSTPQPGQPFPRAEAFRARACSRSSRRQKPGTLRPASQLRFPVSFSRYAAPLTLSRFRTVFHRYQGGQPPQIWPSASPPSLRAGPSRTSPPHSAAIISPATPASPAKAAYIRRTVSKALRWAAPKIRPENPLRVLRSSSRSSLHAPSRSAC